MKRALANIITLIFVGFLLIGLIGVFQNIVHDLHHTFAHKEARCHILAYDRA